MYEIDCEEVGGPIDIEKAAGLFNNKSINCWDCLKCKCRIVSVLKESVAHLPVTGLYSVSSPTCNSVCDVGFFCKDMHEINPTAQWHTYGLRKTEKLQ